MKLTESLSAATGISFLPQSTKLIRRIRRENLKSHNWGPRKISKVTKMTLRFCPICAFLWLNVRSFTSRKLKIHKAAAAKIPKSQKNDPPVLCVL